ncbi:MAG: phosphate acetyltransferase [Propionibacteriaceae bacterium]|nr:phosphate acetyltransferase [Propionibacteriaceae bacterium]
MTCCESLGRTPETFQQELIDKACAHPRTIVLPEGHEDRIITAAGIVLQKGIAKLILLGDEQTIRTRSEQLSVDLDGARFLDPTDPELLDTFATQYAELRKEKGLSIPEARKTMEDLSFFATMMVHLRMADGMVSGAITTTAETIRPAFQFIKTKPGVTSVSGAFLMCLTDRVLVFADCAVTPNPTPNDLAQIAYASAQTARQFNIDPKVAMLSYSTGDSGTGPDVDKVAQATALVKKLDENLAVEGPIQFDAAFDETVAQTKLPGSLVAGHATVYIFPDLNCGNITYKAVQRTAHALPIGPILQGLNRPVNDLSRGALVEDIVNTIAITAIQAQDEPPAGD